jgi:hypothetical protein
VFVFSGLCIQTSVTLYVPQGFCQAEAYDVCRVRAGSYNVTDICLHNPENMNNCEFVPEDAHSCMLLLSQQYGLGLGNLWNLEF